MLIPSIDLMDGQVVQLEQGERLAIASNDLNAWVVKFQRFPLVQVIDLDAAMGKGDNSQLVRQICGRLPCQVGGGIRTPDRAAAVLKMGARTVILGSALFGSSGAHVDRARAFTDRVGSEALVAAVDSRRGKVVIHGWKTPLEITPVDAVRALEPFVARFLYTHVDTEGMLTGLDLDAVKAVKAATSRKLIAAGGIRSQREIDTLDALGIDAVVGMAIYRGIIDIEKHGTS